MNRRLLVGCAVLLLVPATSDARNTADELARGFDLAYNLDHEAAVKTLEAAIDGGL